LTYYADIAFEVFWAVLRHLKSPYRPPKGPLIFKNSVLTYTIFFQEDIQKNWVFI